MVACNAVFVVLCLGFLLFQFSYAVPMRSGHLRMIRKTKNDFNGSKAQIPDGVLIRDGEDTDPVAQDRRDFVKQMIKDAWDDYRKYAWGENELKPVSKKGQSGGIFGDTKIGATIVDSLDTLFITGLDDEYKAGREWVNKHLQFDKIDANVSVFETNIRFLGGLLSIYALTQDVMFKDKAVELADRLLPAFDSPTGIPYGRINLLTGKPVDASSASVLAELGTLHLEFQYLSDLTGNPVYKEKVTKVREVLRNMEKPNGLYWNFLDPNTGEFTVEHVSIGALGDSFYEYLLKASIMFQDNEARKMYDDAMDGFLANDLVRTSKQSRLTYIAELRKGEVQDVVGHLACFAGGMFALGSSTDDRPLELKSRDFGIGQNFTETCRQSYIRSATGIGPEVFRFTESLEAKTDVDSEKGFVLRPEVVESYLVLYRLTGNPKYREWGWEAALAYQRYTKIGHGRGYSGIRDVYSVVPEYDDVQQTFLLAETLKMSSAPNQRS